MDVCSKDTLRWSTACTQSLTWAHVGCDTLRFRHLLGTARTSWGWAHFGRDRLAGGENVGIFKSYKLILILVSC